MQSNYYKTVKNKIVHAYATYRIRIILRYVSEELTVTNVTYDEGVPSILRIYQHLYK
jgi:hypothetical protein